MSDQHEQFEEIFLQIRSDFESRVITKAEYNKKVFNLSYEAALKGLDQESILLFLELDSDYFDTDFIAHARSDEIFHRKGVFLFELYNYLEYIDWPVTATQPGAKA